MKPTLFGILTKILNVALVYQTHVAMKPGLPRPLQGTLMVALVYQTHVAMKLQYAHSKAFLFKLH